MAEGPNITRIAALIGDNARAEVLSALMGGHALTATELADMSGVTRQTISSHLGKLREAGLIEVAQQGRHRYFRLAGDEVAELLESLMGLAASSAPAPPLFGPREPALRKARVCYDHIAGELGVWAFQEMLHHGLFQRDDGGLALTQRGRDWFERLGIDTEQVAAQKRALCRECLDWSERRHHLAGALGAALLCWIQEQGWAQREKGSRTMVFTQDGEKSLRALFQPERVEERRTVQERAVQDRTTQGRTVRDRTAKAV